MSPLVSSFVLGLTAATATVVGGLIVLEHTWKRVYLKYFLALGSGFMLATALLEMVPESLSRAGELALVFVLAGYLLVHFFEHTISPHFHFGEEVHLEEMINPRVGYTAVLGMIIHSFFDGVAIAAGFVVSGWLGMVIFLAVFLHKIPDGFTVASLLIASGYRQRTAVWATVLLGVATLVGVAAMWLLRAEVSWGLALAAGATLYVAASDLMPEVNREPGIKMPLWVFVGVALMLGLKSLLGV
ncbi:MAG: ZIP family metal transporter [Acidobacteria bacterium]|nr:ZIP family metal transporter [Acidobacteriota bacterium]